MSGLEVVVAIAGIVSGFGASVTLFQQWKAKRAKRHAKKALEVDVDVDAGKAETVLQESGPLVQKKFDDDFKRLGRKFAAGDATGRSEMQSYLIILQQSVITLLQDALVGKATDPSLARLLATSNDVRKGSIRVLAEQFQRMSTSAKITAGPVINPTPVAAKEKQKIKTYAQVTAGQIESPKPDTKEKQKIQTTSAKTAGVPILSLGPVTKEMQNVTTPAKTTSDPRKRLRPVTKEKQKVVTFAKTTVDPTKGPRPVMKEKPKMETISAKITVDPITSLRPVTKEKQMMKTYAQVTAGQIENPKPVTTDKQKMSSPKAITGDSIVNLKSASKEKAKRQPKYCSYAVAMQKLGTPPDSNVLACEDCNWGKKNFPPQGKPSNGSGKKEYDAQKTELEQFWERHEVQKVGLRGEPDRFRRVVIGRWVLPHRFFKKCHLQMEKEVHELWREGHQPVYRCIMCEKKGATKDFIDDVRFKKHIYDGHSEKEWEEEPDIEKH